MEHPMECNISGRIQRDQSTYLPVSKRRNKEKPVCICPSNLGPGVKEQKLAGRAQQGTRGEEAQQNEDDMMMSYHGHEQHIATKDNISGISREVT